MSLPSPDQRLQAGAAIFGAGVLLVVSLVIYSMQEKTDYWTGYGILGVCVTAGGLLLLVSGLFGKGKDRDAVQGIGVTIAGDATNSNIVAGDGNTIVSDVTDG